MSDIHPFFYDEELVPKFREVARALCAAVAAEAEAKPGFAVAVNRLREIPSEALEYEVRCYLCEDNAEALRKILADWQVDSSPYNVYVGAAGKPDSLLLLADVLNEDLALEVEAEDLLQEFLEYRAWKGGRGE